jgi:hypothetical protein
LRRCEIAKSIALDARPRLRHGRVYLGYLRAEVRDRLPYV